MKKKVWKKKKIVVAEQEKNSEYSSIPKGDR